ncbi:calcium/sodium antiporter [Caloranaerobacter ferrireducens]|uniref:calcium/sodium antiporter n=1 Tax=Caloranaerobacter ferrireducens TaxID=1323370 RepID=UPI00084DAEF2|nr:calcium/sodium antiporter [Caloranaerobacter ferrireducens]
MFISTILFIFGLILVIKGGDWFVDSSVKIAKISGLPEVFIGATLVSIATTSPEIMVSAAAAVKGHSTMSVGNAIGSIICNIGLILGLTNIIMPSKIDKSLFSGKAFLMVLYMILLFILGFNGFINRVDSIVLIVLFIIYVIYNSYSIKSRKTLISVQSNKRIFSKEIIKIAINFILGITAILIGANLLIDNGVILAGYLGVPEAIIGLTLIALGTSLPELVTAITALRKGHGGLSIGNIIGANILNITLVIGISGVITSLKLLKQNIFFDFPIALILMLLLLIPLSRRNEITRLNGLILLLVYIGYIISLYSVFS